MNRNRISDVGLRIYEWEYKRIWRERLSKRNESWEYGMKLPILSGQTYPFLLISSVSVYFDKVCAMNEPFYRWT